MGVSFENFRRWAEDRFSDVVVKGKEVRINSIFDPDDTNHHLWCSPSGGKKKRKFGVYHCFKTDKKGSLVKLIQIVDSCDRDDALAVLQGQSTLRDLEKRLEEFLSGPEETKAEPPESLKLPAGTFLISELGTNNWWRKKAEEYLASRKIPIDGLYVCTKAPYKFRIIIPYYDRDGNLIYWNARHMGKSSIRYLGPPKECGVGKSDVVYMAGKWPVPGSMVFVCEGEFNAISLKLSELNGAACGGKNMDEKQALMLKDYRIVLCLDRDKAGWRGTSGMSNKVAAFLSGMSLNEKLFYVRPPQGFKDWNEMYMQVGPAVLHAYILKYLKPLDFQAPSGMAGDYFKIMDL